MTENEVDGGGTDQIPRTVPAGREVHLDNVAVPFDRKALEGEYVGELGDQ